MADNNQAEKPRAEGEKKKGKSTLDSVVDELSRAAKNTVAIGAGLAAPLIYPAGELRLGAMTTGYPFAVGSLLEDKMLEKDKPVNWVKAAKESWVGALMTPLLAYTFNYINKIKDYVTGYSGALAGGAAAVGSLAAAQAGFVGVYMGLNHIIQNHSFKGLYGKFKNEYWPIMKRTWKYVLPLSIPNVLIVNQFGVLAQLAYSALIGLYFRLVGPKAEGAKLGNLVSAMNPFPYIKAGFSASGKIAKNLFYAPLKATYDIGSAISSAIQLGPKAAPASSPASAPQPA